MLLWEIGIALALYIACCILTETERWGWMSLVIIAACVAVQWLNVVDLWGFVRHHVGLTALYVLGYLVVGVVWSFLKWLSFLLAFRRERRRERGRSTNWQHVFFRGTQLGQTPLASTNKARIIAWVGYWPFSLIGTVVSDPLHTLLVWLFECLSSSYQRVADYVFRDEPGDAQS